VAVFTRAAGYPPPPHGVGTTRGGSATYVLSLSAEGIDSFCLTLTLNPNP
jgi:hypothetical protein